MTFKTTRFIKVKNNQIEKIDNRIRLAFVRCPKCKRYVNLYKDELKLNDNEVRTIRAKKCSCGMKTVYVLEGWHDK